MQEAQRPRSSSQLTTGMFCQALMGALQAGQAERGVLKVNRSGTVSTVDVVVSALPTDGINSAAWARQSRSSMMGSR